MCPPGSRAIEMDLPDASNVREGGKGLEHGWLDPTVDAHDRECVAADGWYDVVFTTDVDSVCPDVGRYDLVGCSDLTSEAACRATAWDLVGSEPSWWPRTGTPKRS